MKVLSYITVLVIGLSFGYFFASKNFSNSTAVNDVEMDNQASNSPKDCPPIPTQPLPSASSQGSETQNTAAKNSQRPQPSETKDSNHITAQKKRDLNNLQSEFRQAQSSDNVADAMRALDEMEKIDPLSRHYFESKARFLVRQREWDEARPILEACIQTHPNSNECHVDLSSTLLQSGTLSEREAAVKSCLDRFPAEPQCLNMMAITFMNKRQFAKAIEIYKDLLANNGNRRVTFPQEMLESQIGYAYQGNLQFELAIAHFQKGCDLRGETTCRQADFLRDKM